MRRVKKIFGWAQLTLVATMLCLPMLFHTSSSSGNEDENRRLAVSPSWPTELSEFQSFPARTDEYLADHFGFRAQIVRAYTRLVFRTFKRAATDTVLVGRHNFVFLAKNPGETQPNKIWRSCGVLRESNEGAIAAIQQAQTHFAKLEIELAYLFVPTKPVIYSDKLPSGLREQCAEYATRPSSSALLEEAALQAGVPTRYPIEEFRQLRADRRAYYKPQFHWLGEAPMLGAEIATELLKQPVQPTGNLTTEYRKQRPDLARYFPGVDLSFSALAYRIVEGPISSCSGLKCVQNIGKHYSRATGLNQYYNKNVDKGELLVLSDSFGWNLGAPLSLHFAKVTVLDTNNLGGAEAPGFFKWILEVERPTHVLFVYSDSGLPRRLHRDWRLLAGLK